MKVVLFAVQSLDGKITRGDLPGDAFGSAADKAHFLHELRQCDACIMGRTTYETTRERLKPQSFPKLHRLVWTRRPGDWAADTLPGVLEFTAEEPVVLDHRLRELGKTRCALLGGGETNAAWLRAGLVDELHLTVEPVLFGHGTPLLGNSTLPIDVGRLDLIDATPLGDRGSVLLRYRVQGARRS